VIYQGFTVFIFKLKNYDNHHNYEDNDNFVAGETIVVLDYPPCKIILSISYLKMLIILFVAYFQHQQ
jgi:hypothetical protein